MAFVHRQQDRRCASGQLPLPALQEKDRHAVLRQQPRILRQAGVGIDHHPRRMRAGDAAHRQLRIVGEHGADPHHHRIDQRAQAMQMIDRFGSVDVVRVARRGGDPSIQGLAELAENEARLSAALGDGCIELPEAARSTGEPRRRPDGFARRLRQEPRP